MASTTSRECMARMVRNPSARTSSRSSITTMAVGNSLTRVKCRHWCLHYLAKSLKRHRRSIEKTRLIPLMTRILTQIWWLRPFVKSQGLCSILSKVLETLCSFRLRKPRRRGILKTVWLAKSFARIKLIPTAAASTSTRVSTL